MKRHEFDPLSLIFGLLFLLGGIPLVISESGLEWLDGRWIVPAFLIAAGVIVLATARISASNDDPDAEDPFIYRGPE